MIIYLFSIVLVFFIQSTKEEIWTESKIISRHNINQRQFENEILEKLPDSIDWRTKHGVSDIKDIRDYYSGYSWAFAASALMESLLLINNVTNPTLSAQNLVDCVNFTEDQLYSNMGSVYWYLIETGIADEEDYPYSGHKDTCRKDFIPAVLINYTIKMVNEDNIKDVVGLYSPVVALIDGTNLANYTSGIIDHTWCDDAEESLNHATIVIGYDTTEDGTDYWILQNFWGTDWGEDGFFRITRGNNTCGIGLAGTQATIQL